MIKKLPKCKCCKERFYPLNNNSLQGYCLKRDECIAAFAKVAKEKKVKEDNKRQKQETKVMKEKLKTLSEYEAEARKYFQKWVRLRDKDLPCISCNNSNSNRYDGGHWWKAEIYSGLIFHEDNCHKQCSRPCNKDLNGDQANYRIGLVKKIGLERVTWLEENKDRLRTYKFTKQELIDIKEYYKNKIKELNQ